MNLKDLGFSLEQIDDFRNSLFDAQDLSIDEFLRTNRRFWKLGKSIIAAVLLSHEKNFELREKWRNIRLSANTKSLENGNWYRHLWGGLTYQTSFEEFGLNKLEIITFNYDRSLEHYLFSSLKGKYEGKTDVECAEQLKKIPIIHVHGKLGYLEWECPNKPIVKYDLKNYNKNVIGNAASTIMIVHESSKSDEAFQKARGALQTAKRIYCLGFGYDPINLEHLGLKSPSNETASFRTHSKIYGTSLGLNRDITTFVNRIKRHGSGDVSLFNLYDQTVYKFLTTNDVVSLN
jgi:hypothetical protein